MAITSRRAGSARGRRWMYAGAGLFVFAAAACGGGSDLELEAAPTTTERETTTTTERQKVTTTTQPESPEGGYRSARADVSDADGGFTDAMARTDVVFADLAVLDSLTVAPETSGGYDRDLFPHWDDDDRDGCDTRCDVLTSQRLADGSWFSEWDGATETDSSLVHIDHVVALSEAWRSGASEWSAKQRDEFADDRSNLLAVTASSNIRKSDKDAATWFPSRADANCLWARTVVTVKSTWDLSVDPAEKDALGNLLVSCGAVPPTTTTTTTAPPPPPPPPPTTAVAAPPPPPANNCTPGYSPCLPPSSDYDCLGGSGDGPSYTGTVSVDHAYGDPYDLDRDGNGVGCQ